MMVQSEEADSLKVKAQSRQREYERVVQELAQARSREQGHWAKAKEVGNQDCPWSRQHDVWTSLLCFAQSTNHRMFSRLREHNFVLLL